MSAPGPRSSAGAERDVMRIISSNLLALPERQRVVDLVHAAAPAAVIGTDRAGTLIDLARLPPDSLAQLHEYLQTLERESLPEEPAGGLLE